MRALPVGWATAAGDADRRRRLVIELTRATHPDPGALCAACVVAACATATVEDPSTALLEVAIAEEDQARTACAAGDRLAGMLAALRAGTWQPPTAGIDFEPAETVTAALACADGATSLRDGLLRAVLLGGDTDTVAAITGGLLGTRQSVDEIAPSCPGTRQYDCPTRLSSRSSRSRSPPSVDPPSTCTRDQTG